MESVLMYIPSDFSSRLQIGLIFVTTLLLGFILQKRVRYLRYNLPPGPFSWPIIGHQPFLPPQKEVYYRNLAKKYGKIFSLYLGERLTIVLNDHELIREACNKDSIAARPPHSFELVPETPSVGNLNGPEWREQRQFFLRTLRELGMGKTEGAVASAEDQTELIANFVRGLKKEAGRPIRLKESMMTETNNLIFKMMADTTFDEGSKMSQIVEKFQSSVQRYLFVNQKKFYYPFLSPIYNLFNKDVRNGRRNMRELYDLIDKEVSKHEANRVEGENKDYIDYYLQEMGKTKTKSFKRSTLVSNSAMLIAAGAEVTQMSLEWMLLLVVKNPGVQQRVYREIVDVVGKERMPEWKDSPFMPYNQAVFWEVMRYASFMPVNEGRWVLEDEKLGGYDIPKGSTVLMVFHSVHRDPKIWGDPEVFRPERFLSKEGKLLNELVDKVLIFSKGKRNCPGEGLARINIFLYFAAILQAFEVKAPKEGLNDKVNQFLGVQLDKAVFVFEPRK